MDIDRNGYSSNYKPQNKYNIESAKSSRTVLASKEESSKIARTNEEHFVEFEMGKGDFIFSRSKNTLLFEGESLAHTFHSCFLDACGAPCFLSFAEFWGLKGVRFLPNELACAGNTLFDSFLSACSTVPARSKLALVFHGTPQKNIAAILKEGLDATKRSGQSYGAGEYFSTDPGLPITYCRGGHTMLVFLVVVPTVESSRRSKPPEVVVVNRQDHQLPLGVITFTSASKETVARSLQSASARLQALSQCLLDTKERLPILKAKSDIIQLLIKEGIQAASELYSKKCDSLCDLSKREISMYAHQLNDKAFVDFYFPDLPKPLTHEEHNSADILNLDRTERKVKFMEQKKQEFTKKQKTV